MYRAAHHVVPESQLPGDGDAVLLLGEVEDLVLAVLQRGLHVRPVAAAANLENGRRSGEGGGGGGRREEWRERV